MQGKEATGITCRQRALEELGFEFDGEAAEWMRWYAELRDSSQSSMYGSGQGATFYLHNWWAPSLCPCLLFRVLACVAMDVGHCHKKYQPE